MAANTHEVIFTNDSDFPTYTGSSTGIQKTDLEIITHLKADPRNAVAIIGPSGEEGDVAYVWCGAGEDLDNYYFCSGPLPETPNDDEVQGGDLTADQALEAALEPWGGLA